MGRVDFSLQGFSDDRSALDDAQQQGGAMRNRLVHVVILAVMFATGLGVFQSVGAAVTSNAPKPKLEVSMDAPGRNTFHCLATSLHPICDIETGHRLVLRSVTAFSASGDFIVSGKLNGTSVSWGDLITTNFAQTLTMQEYFDGPSITVEMAGAPATAELEGDLLNCVAFINSKTPVDCNSSNVSGHD
jgi:hypothetical protein